MGEKWLDGLAAFNDWVAGVTYTHEHFTVDPTQFVGRVPADVHQSAEKVVVSLVPALVLLVRDLVDDSECSFDHHGGCQEHGYLSLGPGEECPNSSARRLVAAWEIQP